MKSKDHAHSVKLNETQLMTSFLRAELHGALSGTWPIWRGLPTVGAVGTLHLFKCSFGFANTAHTRTALLPF